MSDTPSKTDSPDLTDPEVEGAIPLSSEKELSGKIAATVCRVCGKRAIRYRYAIRRRGSHMYWRVAFVCDGHESTVVFQADWIEVKDEHLP